MYGKHYRVLHHKESEYVDTVLEYAITHFNLDPKPGFNNQVKHCAFNFEPIPYIHRPLLLYITTGVAELVFNSTFLRYYGFVNRSIGNSSYWIRSVPGSASDPMVILHGISTGWSFYGTLIKALMKNRTVILVDVDAIRIKSLAFHMPSAEEFADFIVKVLRVHRIEKVSMVGHSFGSITAGWMVSRHPEVISHLTLIDPVSLLLLLSDVAYNFLYRPPSTAMEWVIHTMASRELTISNMLYRHFWWFRNVLWLEDIPAHIGVVVGVASCDEISKPDSVYEYVLRCKDMRERKAQDISRDDGGNQVGSEVEGRKEFASIEAVLWDNFSHGQILLGGSAQRQFVDLIHQNEKQTRFIG